MGNEMGNSNVSRLQEEENRTMETAEKSLYDADNADNEKEGNLIVVAVEDKDFHEKVAGSDSAEGNQILHIVEDTNVHEQYTGLASGEGNKILTVVEETNFNETVSELASGEGNQIVPAVEATKFNEKTAESASDDGNQAVPAFVCKDLNENVGGLASCNGNQAVPAVADKDFDENVARLTSGEGYQTVPVIDDIDFHEQLTGLASGEGNQLVPLIDDSDFHEQLTELASGEGNQLVPVVSDKDFHEIVVDLPSDEGNQTYTATEDKDIHEKVTGVSNDQHAAGDPCIDHHTSDGIEQDDSKVQPPPGPPQATLESDDGITDSRIHPASLSADDDDEETLIELNLENELLETSEKKNERQISSEKAKKTEKEEVGSSCCTDSAPNSPGHPACVEPDYNQHEIQSKSMQGSEDVLGLSLSCDSGEKDQLDADIRHSTAVEKVEMSSREYQVTGTNTLEEKAEIRDREEVRRGLDRASSGSGNNSDLGLPTEMNLIMGSSMDVPQEAIKENGEAGLPKEMKLMKNVSLDIQQEPRKEDNHDAESSEEMNLICIDSSDSQPEATLVTDSLNCFQDAAKPEDKGVVLTDDTKLIGLILGKKDGMHDLCSTQFCEELVNESTTSKSESFCSDHENNEKEGVIDAYCSSTIDEDFQVEEAKVLDNGYEAHQLESSAMDEDFQVEEAIVLENVYEVHQLKSSAMYEDFQVEEAVVLENGYEVHLLKSSAMDEDFQVEEAMVLENGYEVHLDGGSPDITLGGIYKNPEEEIGKLSVTDTVPAQFILIDYKHEKEEPTDKNMVEDKMEKTEYSFAVGNDGEERKTTEEGASQSNPIGMVESLLRTPPAFPLQSQEHESGTAMGNENFKSRNHSSLELQQHGSGDFSLVKASNSDASHLIMENSVFGAGEFKTADLSNEHCGKDEAPAFPSDAYETQGVGRISTESSPESLPIQAEMRKSPSFHFELLADASTEDSDQTPLLYHDKSITENSSKGVAASFRNPVGEYGQDSVQYQTMPIEENSSKLEKIDSEKSRTPFLSLLKEEEEARLMASQRNQVTIVAEKKPAKEIWNSGTPKRRTKRRYKSSLFSNCICCATAIS